MVFLLYCLSIVSIVGGGALAVYGADTIRSESGATFALVGVALACAGLILLALAAVLAELKRLRRVVEEPEPAVAPTIPHATAPPPPLPPRAPPPQGAMPPPPPGMSPPPLETAPSAVERLRQDLESSGAGPRVASSVAAGVGTGIGMGLAGPAAEQPEAHELDQPADVVAAPQVEAPEPIKAAEAAEAARALDQALAAVAFPDKTKARIAEPDDVWPPPEVPAAAPPTAAFAAERTLVATYNSGGNTYYMFSDGTIETETPTGRYRFNSMEELRVFVENGTGGELLAPPASANQL